MSSVKRFKLGLLGGAMATLFLVQGSAIANSEKEAAHYKLAMEYWFPSDAVGRESDTEELLRQYEWDTGTGDSIFQGAKPQDPKAPPASYRMVIEVFKFPKALGIDKEFVLFTVDGRLEHVAVASTAVAVDSKG